jgi:phage terminase small subunit
MANEKLTPKQQRFCEEYLIDLNGTQAAIRAGYSKKTAKEISAQNLTKLNIAEFIQELKDNRSKSTQITTEWVVKRLKEISDRCMTTEPVMEWQDGKKVPTGEYIFDSSGANRATELLGKHLGSFEADNGQRKDTINISIVKKKSIGNNKS